MNETHGYRSEYWQGREVLPGDSMRFVNSTNIARCRRDKVPRSGGNIAPLFDRDKSGKIVPPRPHRAGEEDYTIGAYITVGDKRAFGKMLDNLNRRVTKAKRKPSARARGKVT